MDLFFSDKLEKVQSCEAPFSLYREIVDPLFGATNTRAPLHRFCTLMRKMRAKSYVLETLQLNTELNEEKEAAAMRCRGEVHLGAKRLTFFASMPSSEVWSDSDELPNEDLLGYAIILSLTLPNGEERKYILEAVSREPSIFNKAISPERILVSNYYVHNSRQFSTSLGLSGQERLFQLKGSFFTQQNDLTSVCAHASLRMALNSSNLLGDTKLTNHRINEILPIDFSADPAQLGKYPKESSDPSKGVTVEQMSNVVRVLGGKTIWGNFHDEPNIEYDQFIYPLAESGCPVILAFQGLAAPTAGFVYHVVAVVGHTLNTDRWEPEARIGYGTIPIDPYIPVVRWADHYIMNDDNYGMYLTLPTDMIRNLLIPSKNSSLHATMAMGIVPKDVAVSGYDSEQIAVHIASQLLLNLQSDPPNYWHERLRNNQGNWVCRTFLMPGMEYRKYVYELAQEKEAVVESDIRDSLDKLPKHVWVSEFSLPNIYTGNKHKLGDVVLDATADSASLEKGESFMMAWFPGFIRPGPQSPIKQWFVEAHVPLIRDSAEISPIEW